MGSSTELHTLLNSFRSQPWSYYDKLCLAPMVRIGTLPLRIMCRTFGAHILYTDEIIDRKIVLTTRSMNEATGLVQYRLPENSSGKSHGSTAQAVFATYQDEPVVFQIGTSDSTLALKAAEHVCRDVKAIDINMGCPRPFSLSGGMGSALLLQPERIHDIVSTLKRNLSIPVTCKIRLLPCPKRTLELCQRIEAAGASAIAVHARYVTDRDRFRCMPHELPPIVSALSIPVIFNGDIFRYEDIETAKRETGAASIMIARGAQWNPSVFSKYEPLPIWNIMFQYLSIAKAVGNSVHNTKYTLMKMKAKHCRLKAAMAFNRANTFSELAADLELLKLDPGVTGRYTPPCVLLDRADTAPLTDSASQD